MANYTAPMGAPQIYNTDLMKVGEQYGTNIGKIASAVSSGFQEDKVNDYIAAYNNPNDTTIFSGLTGSQRSAKLARLLLPLDKDLADQYLKKSNAEQAEEKKAVINKGIAEAYHGVATTEEKPVEELGDIDAELELINNELKRRSDAGVPTMDNVSSVTPNVGVYNRYVVPGLSPVQEYKGLTNG